MRSGSAHVELDDVWHSNLAVGPTADRRHKGVCRWIRAARMR
jgi:hypothetical protein